MKAGINLYSIRSLIQTEAELVSSLHKLRAAGYSYVQYSGAEFDAERIARAGEESGMAVYLTHVPMERIIRDTEKLMEEHARFGCKNIGLGMMPLKIFADEKESKKTIGALERAAEKMRKNGFAFFYHHHHFEFFKRDGETVLEYMLKNAPHINFTADTYWLQYGGASIGEFMKKLKGRMGCVHLKDYKIEKRRGKNGEIEFGPVFAPLGEGTIDFKTLVPEMKELGTEYYFVEQDNASEFADPIAQVARSMEYIKKEL